MDREILETMNEIRRQVAPTGAVTVSQCATCEKAPARSGGDCLSCLERILAAQLGEIGINHPARLAARFVVAQQMLRDTMLMIEQECGRC